MTTPTPKNPVAAQAQGVTNAPDTAEQSAAHLQERNAAFNPASTSGVAAEPLQRKRIPLSVPRRKLEARPIPGYVLYWFKESNIPIAIDAGYDFVDGREVQLNQSNEANHAEGSGNTDLGSRVSVIGDRIGERGTSERLVLMKIREEFWLEDRKLLDDANAAVLSAIFKGVVIGTERGGDHSQSYVSTAIAQGSGRLLNRGLKKQT